MVFSDILTGANTPWIVVQHPTGSFYYVYVTDTNGCGAMDSIYLYWTSINDIYTGVSLRLYPNPSRYKVNIEFSQQIKLDGWQLFDGMGRLTESSSLSVETGRLHINVSTLSKGHYYLKLVFGKKSKTLPIFVQ